MKSRWRTIAVASAALAAAGAPAQAQDASLPPPESAVGSPQLRNFSINGTVTRPAEQQQQAQPPAPAPARVNEPRAAAAEPVREQASQSAERSIRQRTRDGDGGDGEATARVSRQASLDLPPPTPARSTSEPLLPQVQPAASSASFAPSADSGLEPSHGGVSILPWLLAALGALLAGAWYFFLRQRPRESFAGGGALAFQAPSPAPAPVRTGPKPPQPAATPAPTGLVSTRLRPSLEVEFTPLRAVVDDTKAAIEFELTLVNSGSAPAADVLAEACMFNAGPLQDRQIRAFFDNPVAQGERIPLIAPMQRLSLKSLVVLPRDQVKPIEVEGRQLFVPLVGFNVLYRWRGGEGQSSASYLVGRQTEGDKLAPFRLDKGARMFRKLDSREHELRLRR